MNSCHSNYNKEAGKKTSANFARKGSSILSGIVICLLPKCPFCIVAYTSTVTLCSTSGVMNQTHHHTDWGAYLAVALCAIITTCIVFTFKINRGIAAYIITSFMAIAGSVMVLSGVFRPSSMEWYYAGAVSLTVATMLYSNLFKAAYELLKFKNSVKHNLIS